MKNSAKETEKTQSFLLFSHSVRTPYLYTHSVHIVLRTPTLRFHWEWDGNVAPLENELDVSGDAI